MGLGKLSYIILWGCFHTATEAVPVLEQIFVSHEFPFQYMATGFHTGTADVPV